MRHQDPLKNLTGFSDFKNVTMAIMAIMAKSKVTSHAGQVLHLAGVLSGIPRNLSDGCLTQTVAVPKGSMMILVKIL